jgi:quercetin dioxygenase-like cupin family protein
MCESSTGTAVGTIQLENDRVRVTEWRFHKLGDNTGWHTHLFDYIVVPLFDGVLEIDQPDGNQVQTTLQNGVSYYREAGVEHDVINGNDFECAFVEIELLE